MTDSRIVPQIRGDLEAYADLGTELDSSSLATYCTIAERVRATYRAQQAAMNRAVRAAFDAAVRAAEDELIRVRLAAGPIHTVFQRTIPFLLRRHGPMTTRDLHPLIAAIHPDLCDDTVDRVIDGKRFGKKWKHAVRTAQQHLKATGVIDKRGAVWGLRQQ